MRRRILLLAVGLTTLVVLAFAIPLTFLIRTAVAQRAGDAAIQQARSTALYLRNSTSTVTQLKDYVASQAAATGRPLSITLPNGKVIGSTPADDYEPGPRPSGDGASGSDSPGGGPPDEGAPSGGGSQPAQADLHPVHGGQVATSSATGPSGAYLVRVFLSNDARYQGATRWYLLLGAGSLGLLLIGIAAGELLTRRITRPLVRTAETAQLLSLGDTTARAPTEGPREVADVGKALNRLADRIDELIAEERETVADLSHRLRTPLMTLRLDAEALNDPDEAERVGGHVSDLERMLTAVIRAARRPQREGRLPSCDATEIVRERVRFWSALTDEQGRSSRVELPAAALPVRASAEDLAAAVNALLENVVAHTHEGTAFTVRLTAEDGGARLEIADDGPGIPAEAELRGRSDRGSTGLGLDIARRCAEASGGAMSIGRSPSGGALVTLRLRSL
jgi:signal transduction histidine kinase